MNIDEYKSNLWREVHGLVVDTLINNLATTKYANEQLFDENCKMKEEIKELKNKKDKT